MIVDSKPIEHDPPSKIQGIFPLKSLIQCFALVVEGLPDKFADGATNKVPLSLITALDI